MEPERLGTTLWTSKVEAKGCQRAARGSPKAAKSGQRDLTGDLGDPKWFQNKVKKHEQMLQFLIDFWWHSDGDFNEFWVAKGTNN